ncbi:2-hydroxy-3-oxopropionate reductase [Pseudoroseomonas rhizosphaerae]|uniref:2-hydroxy-3-oxopropionate reductase n=1 Tax=Teichococcus rhizosphaerae TaxID=1335062 RepID=A0A2C6XY97_9PROT|nr:NAD(P)-dependent oxidoreductase [Pseudoroseomonas rhizosphaerae]PHK93512.1 2-hydroxy-3-oxopropionate reductase [Pseudoroseomonas rhizosphaerae]
MSKQPAIGMIGIGLMGHGIAWNIAKAGHDLTILDHPGNQPVDDLRGMGVKVAGRIADIAQAADIIILCVTGSPQVEAILAGEDGVIAHLRPGTVVMDCSTALPESSRRMAAAIAAAGGQFLDAAMTRLPQHARAGTLNLLVGGDPALLERLRPLLETFSENITHIGGVGSGHLMKLMHNYVSLGFLALLAEVAAHGQKAGLEMATLIDVLAQGGGGGAALQRISPFLLEGDPSSVPFYISNAAKDLGYYRQAAGAAGAHRVIADAVGNTLDRVVADGHGQDFVPQLAELLKSSGKA